MAIIYRFWLFISVSIVLSLSGCASVNRLADQTNFLPHAFCMRWDKNLLTTMIVANLGIALAYFAIPLALWYFVRHRKDLPYPWMFRLFGMFIVACGTTHLMKVWTLYQPFYWAEALIDLYTAIISLVTAFFLWPLIPKALTLKSPYELEDANQKLKNAAQRNQKAEQKFRGLLESAPDAMVIVDVKGDIALVNSQTEHLFGYSRDELLGHPVEILIPKRFHGSHPGGGSWFFTEPQIRSMGAELELYALRKDGTEFPVEISLSPIETEGGLLVSSAIRDVSERKKVIDKLQAQAELLNLTHDMIFVRHMDGTIRYWSRGAQETYGFTEAEAIGQQTHHLLRTEHPIPKEQIDKEILLKERWDGELIHYTRDGRRLVVESRQVLKRDVEGKPALILEINTNITERKQAEMRQQALAEMTRAHAELEQFAYVASHDLQEPLRAVAGCLQILEKTYKGKLDNNADELIQHAIDGAVRMRALINDLLALSRVSSDTMTFNSIDTAESLNNALRNLDATIKETGAKITHDQLPKLSAESTQLTQLFQNLISNAIKFRGNSPPEIHIAAEHEDGEWLFSIKDNGIGFEQEYAARIFQPFKRLHSRDKYPGTGIGLAICKRIIERHGGKIWVKSEPGHGTTFFFTIIDREEES